MSAGQGSCPLPWHRASFPADLFPQSQPHRAALEVRQKTVPLFDLLQRLRRLLTGHLRLPCPNQHRPQGHSRFPPHPPFPDVLKITDREEVKYISALQLQSQLGLGSYRTAWMLCAKLPRAMVNPEREPLCGVVEADETIIPFRTKQDPIVLPAGRSGVGKMLVAG